MGRTFSYRLAVTVICSCLLFVNVYAFAQTSKVMGEVQFEGATKVEKDSGVWVDNNYVGYLKELKGDKKVRLALPMIARAAAPQPRQVY